MTLGPKVTYRGNHPNDKRSVVMAGVVFKPGQPVNLIKELGEAKAKPILQKLAGNTFFAVDGGPDWTAAYDAAVAGYVEHEASEEADEALIAGDIANIAAPEVMTLETPPSPATSRRKAT